MTKICSGQRYNICTFQLLSITSWKANLNIFIPDENIAIWCECCFRWAVPLNLQSFLCNFMDVIEERLIFLCNWHQNLYWFSIKAYWFLWFYISDKHQFLFKTKKIYNRVKTPTTAWGKKKKKQACRVFFTPWICHLVYYPNLAFIMAPNKLIQSSVFQCHVNVGNLCYKLESMGQSLWHTLYRINPYGNDISKSGISNNENLLNM